MQQALQKIIFHMESKNFDKALELCERVITSGFNHPQLLTIKAIALSKTNQFKDSQQLFEFLLKKLPQHSELHYNYALVLQENDQKTQALKHYQRCIELNNQHASAHNNTGVIHLHFNNFSEAKRHFDRALSLQPSNLEYLRNLANACFQLKHYSQCTTLINSYINTKHSEAEDFVLLIDCLYNDRELHKAQRICKFAINKYKENAELYNLAALIETDCKKYYLAQSRIKKALKIDAKNLDFLINQITVKAHIKPSQVIIKKLIKLHKAFPRNLALLQFSATLCESLSEFKKAKHYIKKGLAVDTNNSKLLLIKAKIYTRKSQFKKSIKLLNKILETSKGTQFKSDIHFELTKIYDKCSEYGKAWNSLITANQIKQNNFNISTPENRFVKDTQNQALDFKNNYISKQACTAITNTPEKATPSIVFIVGFPRSGTTLVEKILQSHPQVKVLEETHAINEIAMDIDQQRGSSYTEKLNRLTPQQIQAYRDNYIDNIKHYTLWQTGDTLVDKMPMNGMQLALINTIFPQAKIIFSLRHPVDVCLSSLMQNMLQISSFSSAAKVYDAYMHMFTVFSENIGLNLCTVKYEELISNMTLAIKDVLSFIGLGWHENMENFHEHKTLVNTPSYQQVSQPIYLSAKYRYMNYINYFKQDIGPLNKWMKYFDYS